MAADRRDWKDIRDWLPSFEFDGHGKANYYVESAGFLNRKVSLCFGWVQDWQSRKRIDPSHSLSINLRFLFPLRIRAQCFVHKNLPCLGYLKSGDTWQAPELGSCIISKLGFPQHFLVCLAFMSLVITRIKSRVSADNVIFGESVNWRKITSKSHSMVVTQSWVKVSLVHYHKVLSDSILSPCRTQELIVDVRIIVAWSVLRKPISESIRTRQFVIMLLQVQLTSKFYL
jgi:hypothetical protein